jgi:hypothetical protein
MHTQIKTHARARTHSLSAAIESGQDAVLSLLKRGGGGGGGGGVRGGGGGRGGGEEGLQKAEPDVGQRHGAKEGQGRVMWDFGEEEGAGKLGRGPQAHGVCLTGCSDPFEALKAGGGGRGGGGVGSSRRAGLRSSLSSIPSSRPSGQPSSCAPTSALFHPDVTAAGVCVCVCAYTAYTAYIHKRQSDLQRGGVYDNRDKRDKRDLRHHLPYTKHFFCFTLLTYPLAFVDMRFFCLP